MTVEVPVLRPLTAAPDSLTLVKPSRGSGMHLVVDADGTAYGALDRPALVTGARVAQTAEMWWTFTPPLGFVDTHIDVGDARGTPLGRWEHPAFERVSTFRGFSITQLGTGPFTFMVQTGGATLLAVLTRPTPWVGTDRAEIRLSDAARADPQAPLLVMLTAEVALGSERRHPY